MTKHTQPLLSGPGTLLDHLTIDQVEQLRDALTTYLDHRRVVTKRRDALAAAQQQHKTLTAAIERLPVVSRNGH